MKPIVNSRQIFPARGDSAVSIEFDLRIEANVTLKIYEISGEEIGVLLDNSLMGAGTHRIAFDLARDEETAILYRLSTKAGDKTFVEVKRLLPANPLDSMVVLPGRS